MKFVQIGVPVESIPVILWLTAHVLALIAIGLQVMSPLAATAVEKLFVPQFFAYATGRQIADPSVLNPAKAEIGLTPVQSTVVQTICPEAFFRITEPAGHAFKA